MLNTTITALETKNKGSSINRPIKTFFNGSESEKTITKTFLPKSFAAKFSAIT